MGEDAFVNEVRFIKYLNTYDYDHMDIEEDPHG